MRLKEESELEMTERLREANESIESLTTAEVCWSTGAFLVPDGVRNTTPKKCEYGENYLNLKAMVAFWH